MNSSVTLHRAVTFRYLGIVLDAEFDANANQPPMEARTITNPTTVIVADLDMNADLSPVEQTTSPTGLLESGFEEVTNYPPVETRTTTNQHSNRPE